MAIFDIVKWDLTSDEELVWKFPSNEIPLGSQLIVSATQECYFRRNGQNVDRFTPGNHTLTSANLPLLNKVVNLPFGGNSPFAAEVWFVSKTSKRDMKWGTSAPIQVMEPKFNIPVNVRAFGQWGVQLTDGSLFLEELVGTRKYADSSQVYEYFRGELIQSISQVISRYVTDANISVFTLNSRLSEIVIDAKKTFTSSLERYGITLTNLTIDRISIPDEELNKLQEIMLKRAEVEQLGDIKVSESYKAIRGLDIMEAAAKNESPGIAPLMAQAGIGAAIGLQTMNATPPTAPISQDDVIQKLKKLKELLDVGILTQDEFDNKKQDLISKL